MIHLNIGLSALRTSQTALNTIANNIANATTEGYRRQEVIQEALPGTVDGAGHSVGAGVDIGQIRRLYDVSVERALTGNTSYLADAEARLDTLDDIELLLTPASGSLHSEISEFFTYAEQLAASPSDNVLRSQFLNAADGVAREINRLAEGFAELQADLHDQIESDVARVNELAANIAEVNQEIRVAQATGSTPNTLLDRRDQLIREPVRVRRCRPAVGQRRRGNGCRRRWLVAHRDNRSRAAGGFRRERAARTARELLVGAGQPQVGRAGRAAYCTQ